MRQYGTLAVKEYSSRQRMRSSREVSRAHLLNAGGGGTFLISIFNFLADGGGRLASHLRRGTNNVLFRGHFHSFYMYSIENPVMMTG